MPKPEGNGSDLSQCLHPSLKPILDALAKLEREMWERKAQWRRSRFRVIEGGKEPSGEAVPGDLANAVCPECEAR
jgi:hypothetical protein